MAGRWTGACLVLAALAAKLVVLGQLHDHPLLEPSGRLDTAVYVDLGRRVAAGDLGLGTEPYFVAPLYAYFLGLVFALSGGSLFAARLVQVALGALAVGLVHLTARLWGPPRAAVLAAGLLAGTGVLSFYEVTLLQAAIDPFLTAAALFLVARALAAGTALRFAAAGIGLGLLALNRPNALASVPVLALLLLLRMDLAAGIRSAAALAAGAALAVAPATLRNWTVSGEPVLVSSHGGLNFYVGNRAGADGTYRSVPGIAPDIAGQAGDARRMAEAARGRPLSAGEVSGHFYGLSLEWMRSRPAEAAGLFLRKTAYLLSDADIPLNHSYAYYRRDEATLLRLLVVGPWLLVPLGLVGLGARLLLGPERDRFAAWASFVPAYGLSVAAFFVTSRYRLPLLVPLAVGAGYALDRLAATAGERRWRRLGAYALATAPLALLALWPHGLDDGRSEERAALLERLVDGGRGAEALARLAGVEAGDPRAPAVLHRVGRAFLDRGEAAQAAALFERARALEPEQPEVRFDLARALAADGRRDEAVRALESLPRPTDARSGLAVGVLALELGRPDLARGPLEESARLSPDSALSREKLGLALALLGRPEDARRELEEACRLDPASASARQNLAVVYGQLGRVPEARRAVERALALRPDYPEALGLRRALEGGRR